ncbi:MAG: 50S ribosomal protein L3 [Candidatus Marinimicrobia bacterium]|nr:50S ribosomal protein L3 [Candidatus Neomarinimicrobiota bacterium]
MLGIIGKKIGMSQVFEEDGKLLPVTVIEAGPCQIIQIKTPEKDGYAAVQLGFGKKPEKRVNKPMLGHFKAANVEPYRIVSEIRDFETADRKPGDTVTVDIFKVGETVKVTGTSKGKGFQGVVKRHNFGGGPKTHGQSDRFRSPGSIGASAYPSRVIKGLKMAGRMGNDQVTVRGLKIVKIDADNHLLYVKGAVPGTRNSIVTIRRQEQ